MPGAFDDIFQLGYTINRYKVRFDLCPDLWNSFEFTDFELSTIEWKEIKYLDESGTNLNPKISEVPNDTGGLYLFVIKCSILGSLTEYLAYIGRAKLTDKRNLRRRVNEYFGNYSRSQERPKISAMMLNWGKYLYLKYAEIDSNDSIDRLEEELINALLPPFNSEIPNKKVRDAIKAFDYQK